MLQMLENLYLFIFIIFGHFLVSFSFFPKKKPGFQVIVFKSYSKFDCTFFSKLWGKPNSSYLRTTSKPGFSADYAGFFINFLCKCWKVNFISIFVNYQFYHMSFCLFWFFLMFLEKRFKLDQNRRLLEKKV